jgi:hypothetical protein
MSSDTHERITSRKFKDQGGQGNTLYVHENRWLRGGSQKCGTWRTLDGERTEKSNVETNMKEF